MGCTDSRPAGKGVSLSAPERVDAGAMVYKVVMVGDRAVGKTCITLRFTKGEYSDRTVSTIGAAFSSKEVEAQSRSGQTTVKLHVWDTAGEEAYRAMTKTFFREASGACLVYDLTDRKTFEHAAYWIVEFRKQCSDAAVILVGNKADRTEARAVTRVEGEEFARLNRCEFAEVSAKTGAGVPELYRHIAQLMVNKTQGIHVAAS